MQEKIFYLNKSIRKQLFFLEILYILISLSIVFLFYLLLPYPKSLLILVPIILFFSLRLFFFARNKKALFFNKTGIYTYRSGWIYWGEIKDIFTKEVKRPFVKKQRCIFFDINVSDIYEKPLLSVDWPLYLLPSNIIVVCENDVDDDLQDIVAEIKSYNAKLTK